MTNEESQRELAMAWGAELAARVSALEIIVALDAIDVVLDNGQWIGALRLSVLRAQERRVEAKARTKALREARDAIETAFGHDEDVSAQDVIDRMLAAETEKGLAP